MTSSTSEEHGPAPAEAEARRGRSAGSAARLRARRAGGVLNGGQRPRSRKPRATTSLRRSRLSGPAADLAGAGRGPHRLVRPACGPRARRDPARLRDQPSSRASLRAMTTAVLDRLAAPRARRQADALDDRPDMRQDNCSSAVGDGVEPGHPEREQHDDDERVRAEAQRQRSTPHDHTEGIDRRSARSRARRATPLRSPDVREHRLSRPRGRRRGRGRPGTRSRRRCRRPRA